MLTARVLFSVLHLSGNGRLNSIGEVVGPLHCCGVELSNQVLLRVAAFSFLVFVLAEVVGALASNSLSLLGDAAAMSVDVFTVRVLPDVCLICSRVCWCANLCSVLLTVHPPVCSTFAICTQNM